jgi:hypothetical protein
MAEILSHGRPVLLYTFYPESVAGTVHEGYFTIKDDTVDYRVTGGKHVRHKIWNYNEDTLYTENSVVSFWQVMKAVFSWLTGGRFVAGYTVSTVDQYNLSPHRRLVLIVPFAQTPSLEGISGEPLQRMKYTVPGGQFNLLTLVRNDEKEPTVSLSQVGELCTAEMPLSTFESVVLGEKHAKTTFLSDTIRRSLLPATAATVLHAYVKEHIAYQPCEVHMAGQLARHYQSVDPRDDNDPYEQGTEYAREYAPGPLSETAVFPVESPNNDSCCIRGRLEEPQAKAKRRMRDRIPPRFYRYANEFIDLVLGDVKHTGVPITVEQVNEKQNRPTQRARSERVMMDSAEEMSVKAFQKREAYNTVNNPRNISTVHATHTLQLSSFTYAFKEDVLKEKDWYMPCRTPAEIAEAVQQLASECNELVETDFSRFDGSLTYWVRKHVEHALYLTWVSKDHKAELARLLLAELNPPARTRTGKYQPGCSRLSGSPVTTDGNTEIVGFCGYASNREHGMSPQESIMKIGLGYGDDGLRTGEVPDATLIRTAHMLGLDLRIEKRATKHTSVSFLSRVFIDPWTTPASIQSPLRTLLKLHTTTNKMDDIVCMGMAKTDGYLITDSQTPFIGDWCRAYQRNVRRTESDAEKMSRIRYRKKQETNHMDDIPYWSRDEEKKSQPWPQGEQVRFLGLVADHLGVTSSELQAHLDTLINYSGPVEKMPRLSIQPQKPKIDATLQGEIIAGPSQDSKQTDANTTDKDVRSKPPRDLRRDRDTRVGDARAKNVPRKGINIRSDGPRIRQHQSGNRPDACYSEKNDGAPKGVPNKTRSHGKPLDHPSDRPRYRGNNGVWPGQRRGRGGYVTTTFRRRQGAVASARPGGDAT